MNSFSFIGKIAYAFNLKYIQYYTIWTKKQRNKQKNRTKTPLSLYNQQHYQPVLLYYLAIVLLKIKTCFPRLTLYYLKTNNYFCHKSLIVCRKPPFQRLKDNKYAKNLISIIQES